MSDFEMVTGYLPGTIGRVTELHAQYYSKHWGFHSYFEVKVATELSGFIENYDSEKDCIYSILKDGRIEGSISIEGTSEFNNIAHLRWFIMSDKLKGQGAGNELMQQAMKFSRVKSYNGVYLWTFKGLSFARHLYEKFGFVLSEEIIGEQWGTTVKQRFETYFSKSENP